MTHSLIVGGLPDYLGEVVTAWAAHGREITAGDAEKTLDQTPSVRHRAPSVGSGEHFYQVNMSQHMNNVPLRGILGSVHNLMDVGAKVRSTLCQGGPGFETVLPTSTVVGGTSNTTHGFAEVDNDPYTLDPTSATFAARTVGLGDWSIEVGFTNSDPLNLAVEDSQIILVYLRQQGTDNVGNLTQGLIEVKEGATVRASKRLRIRLGDEGTMIAAVLVDPNDFSDNTLNGMSVKFTSDTGGGGMSWEVFAIVWRKFEEMVESGSGLQVDTGWVDVESGAADLYHLNADAQATSVLAYLDADGELEMNSTANILRVFFYWDESSTFNGIGFNQKERIFEDTDGNLRSWRPEIGVVVEGPAWATDRFQFGSQPGFKDSSPVLLSAGGNRWIPRRQEPLRTHVVKAFPVDAVEAVQNLYSVARRAGHVIPWLVAIRPDRPELGAAFSMYAVMTRIDPPAEMKVVLDGELTDVVSVAMTFEEVA